jgi:hypothetical protein
MRRGELAGSEEVSAANGVAVVAATVLRGAVRSCLAVPSAMASRLSVRGDWRVVLIQSAVAGVRSCVRDAARWRVPGALGRRRLAMFEVVSP